MKRFKGIFLVLVIMFSLGISTVVNAKDGDSNWDRQRDRQNSSRERSERGKKDRSSGPRLDYNGKTSGLGRELGGIVGGAAGASKGGLAGGYIGGKIGSRAGDSWERRTNRGSHDKWNNKGRKDRGYGGGWRFSLDEDYED